MKIQESDTLEAKIIKQTFNVNPYEKMYYWDNQYTLKKSLNDKNEENIRSKDKHTVFLENEKFIFSIYFDENEVKNSDYHFYHYDSKFFFQFLNIKVLSIEESELLSNIDPNLHSLQFLFYMNNLYQIKYKFKLKKSKFENLLETYSNSYSPANIYKKINTYEFLDLTEKNPFEEVLYKDPQNYVAMTIKDSEKNNLKEDFIKYQKSLYKYHMSFWKTNLNELYLIFEDKKFDNHEKIEVTFIINSINLKEKVSKYHQESVNFLKQSLQGHVEKTVELIRKKLTEEALY